MKKAVYGAPNSTSSSAWAGSPFSHSYSLLPPFCLIQWTRFEGCIELGALFDLFVVTRGHLLLLFLPCLAPSTEPWSPPGALQPWFGAQLARPWGMLQRVGALLVGRGGCCPRG